VSVATRPVNGRFGSYELAGEPLEVPGSARIYRILGRPELLYKEFGRPLRGATEAERIEGLVKVGAAVAEDQSERSRRHVGWPVDDVIEEAAVVGVLIPYAGDKYYKNLSGETLVSRNLNHLRLAKEGVPIEIRLLLLRQLSSVLRLLEFADLVHGDISAQNVLWRVDPQPSIFLIDCDGMHSSSVDGFPATTEGWTDPRKDAGEIASHDMQSDWFALALAVWRVTTLSKGAPTSTDHGLQIPSSISSGLRDLVRRSFEDVMDAEARPSPIEWMKALDSVLGNRRAQRRIERHLSPQTIHSRPIHRTPLPEPPTARQQDTPTSSRGRRRWASALRTLILAPFLALVGVIGSGWLATSPHLGQLNAQAATGRWARPHLPNGDFEVSCPSNSSLHNGARYVCRLETAGGAVAHVRVKVAGGTAERHMQIVAYRARAFVADLRNGYRRGHEQGLSYALSGLSCPHTVSAKAGTKFRCTAEFTDQTAGVVRVVLHDRRGAYTWREVGTPVRGEGRALS
jgi:hypothetical protein